MQTRVVRFDDEGIAAASQLIRTGAPVAVPTETVYGLAADARSTSAVAAIFEAKQRPPTNPLIVHVADLAAAHQLGVFSPTANALAAAHWPGPLTIVVPLRTGSGIAELATAGLATIALRVPSHRVMQALLRSTGAPLATPSANASGTISPTRADHVLRTLAGRIAMIIDDGPTAGGIESTIVKVTGDRIVLLRPGPLAIEHAIVEPASAKIESPGQMLAHYAPSKPLRLDVIAPQSDEWHIGFGRIAGDISLSASGDLGEAARSLFELLHNADQSPALRIAVAPIPHAGLGLAINDRLRRAAAGSA